MSKPTASSSLVGLLLLTNACGTDVAPGGWDFRDASGAHPDPAPIERICDGKLPPEMTVTEPGVDTMAYSLAIGPDGCPHIAWYANRTIHYARWDGSTWREEAAYAPSHTRHTLDVGDDGRPTLLVSHVDEPRVLRLQRTDDGNWVEQEEVANRWSWGMHFVPVAPDRKALLMNTADNQYSGEDLTVRILTQKNGEWSQTRIVDFLISYDLPRTLAVDSQGRGIVPILQNKYGPFDGVTNLWVARSTDETLSAWEAERVETPGFERFQSTSIVAVRERPHIIAAPVPTERAAETALLHLQLDEQAQWRSEQFASCVCGVVRAVADSRGRIHVLFEVGQPEMGLRYALYDEGRWSFQDLGPYTGSPRVDVALEVDPVTDAVHVVTAQTEGPMVRNLIYLTVTP